MTPGHSAVVRVPMQSDVSDVHALARGNAIASFDFFVRQVLCKNIPGHVASQLQAVLDELPTRRRRETVEALLLWVAVRGETSPGGSASATEVFRWLFPDVPDVRG
jgi:hypothetical protein